MRDKSNKLLGSFVFQRMALGGGGFTMRPKFADDGTITISTDTDQGFFRAPGDTMWTQMLRVGDNITYITDFTYGYAAGGTFDTAVHKTNSRRMATWFGGFLWLTADRFATVTRANLAKNDGIGGNGNGTPSHRIEFDAGEGVLIFCDPTAGIRYTEDGGSSFTTVASVPSGGYGTFIAIDRSSSVSDGKHQTVYAYSYGHGVYRSTTGIDGTFSLIASRPANLDTQLRDIKVGPTGVLWCTRVASPGVMGTALKWTSGGGWVEITGSGGAAGASACVPDLKDEDRCLFISESGALLATVDGAAVDRSGPGDTSGKRVATDIPWLAWTNENYLANGGGAFDPTDPTRLVIGQGIGVWEAFNVLKGVGLNAAPTWTSLTKGIDQLCVIEQKTTPLDDLIVSVLDRDYFVLNTNFPDRFPTRHGPTPGTGYPTHSQGIDWAGDDPSFVVGVCSVYPYIHYSPDRGVSWNLDCAPAGSLVNGNVAASTTRNWVWFGTNNTGCYYTEDGGASWDECSFGGSAMAGVTLNAYNHLRQVLVADKANPGHFYCFIWGDGAGNSGGFWKSTDGGANWTRLKVGYFTTAGRDFWNCKLRIYSRGAGLEPDLFWTVGDESSPSESTIGDEDSVLFSRGGSSWRALPNCTEFQDIAFGKPVLDHDYPCLYANGFYKGVLGFYCCTDFDPDNPAKTVWKMPGDRFPMGSTDVAWTISASMNTHAVTIGHGGSGLIAGGQQWRLRAKATGSSAGSRSG